MRFSEIRWKVLYGLVLAFVISPCLSEANGLTDSLDSHSPELASVASPSTKSLTERWLDLRTLSYNARYRNTVNDDGRRLFEFGQQRYVADGRFKLDAAGKYGINFHASSGRYFNWSYADLIGGQYKDSVVAARAYKTPAEKAALAYALRYDPNDAIYKAGLPSRGGYFYLRQLFFSATPVSQFTVEFGSLFIEHGENTEITSFDHDGYISGERVRLHDRKHLFFDQLAATSAEMNSPLVPNFFARGADLKRSNYTQYLAEKKLAGHYFASVDYTMLNHTHTMREGFAYKAPGGRFIDSALFEAYQRPGTVRLAERALPEEMDLPSLPTRPSSRRSVLKLNLPMPMNATPSTAAAFTWPASASPGTATTTRPGSAALRRPISSWQTVSAWSASTPTLPSRHHQSQRAGIYFRHPGRSEGDRKLKEECLLDRPHPGLEAKVSLSIA